MWKGPPRVLKYRFKDSKQVSLNWFSGCGVADKSCKCVDGVLNFKLPSLIQNLSNQYTKIILNKVVTYVTDITADNVLYVHGPSTQVSKSDAPSSCFPRVDKESNKTFVEETDPEICLTKVKGPLLNCIPYKVNYNQFWYKVTNLYKSNNKLTVTSDSVTSWNTMKFSGSRCKKVVKITWYPRCQKVTDFDDSSKSANILQFLGLMDAKEKDPYYIWLAPTDLICDPNQWDTYGSQEYSFNYTTYYYFTFSGVKGYCRM